MLTTEQEAAAKWCPQSRVIVIAPQGMPMSMPFNRTLQAEPSAVMAPPGSAGTGEVTLMLPDSARCAGSACMMWRWFDKESGKADERRGFCGLAMNPLTYTH